MPVTMTKDGMAAFERAVRDLVKNQVLVGIPAEDAARTPEPGEPSPIDNATIGYINEFGAPERNIPARPHLLPGIEKVQSAISNQLRKAGEAALSGADGGVDRGLNAAGLIAQNSVRATVTEGGFTPLSERTLKARKARGRTGDKPLIDTGQYRRALTYVIRRKGT